jgi:hypothetical protein
VLPDGVPGVPGVVPVEGSGVSVGALVSVGKDRPGFVGASVAVTKAGAAGTGVSPEILTQEARLRLASSIKIQIFFIGG